MVKEFEKRVKKILWNGALLDVNTSLQWADIYRLTEVLLWVTTYIVGHFGFLFIKIHVIILHIFITSYKI